MRLQAETARNYPHILRVSAILTVLWLFTVPLLYRGLQQGGISVFPTDYDLGYIQRTYGGDFSNLRLDDSYQTWAKKLGQLNASGYLRSALGFADGTRRRKEPIPYFNFSLGLFMSEPPSEVVLIAALIGLQNF